MNESLLVNRRACAAALERLEALVCSDGTSRTFGCVDRDFWAYRTLRGFPSAPYQHVMSGLAYLSQCSEGFDSRRLGDLSLGSLDFWLRSRNGNGSANEWYRNEQSYCATAMGMHSAVEALWLLRDRISERDLRERCRDLVKSARWLQDRNNPLATNQDVASTSGRFVLAALLDDNHMRDSALRSLERIQTRFFRDGYLREYEGMDLGYTLLSLDLLVASHRAGMSECETLVSGLCRQLVSVSSPTGDLPFALGSRGTLHRFFGGVEYFSRFVDSASGFRLRAIGSGATAQADALMRYDDRYLATFAFSALARRHHSEQVHASHVGSREPETRALPQPPIRGASDENGTLFVHRQFGHGLSWTSRSGETITHLGYVFTERSGRRWTSLVRPEVRSSEYQFARVSDALPLQRWEAMYRLVFSLCRISLVARAVSWWARTRVGRPQNTRDMWLHREVVESRNGVTIRDRIRVSGRTTGKITVVSAFPYHSPSLTSSVAGGFDESLFLREIDHVSGDGEIVIGWRIVPNTRGSGIVDVL